MALVLILIAARLNNVVRTQYLVTQFLRSLMLMAATTVYFTGVGLIALTDAAALMAVNPVLIALGAAAFFWAKRWGHAELSVFLKPCAVP